MFNTIETYTERSEVHLAMKNKKNTALLICAMHRSGSSILTRSFNLLGYGVSKTQIGINKENQTGHWESRKLARVNDRLLSAYDLTWDSWKPLMKGKLPESELSNFKSDIINTIKDDFVCDADIVIKDPRICRLAETYLGCIDQLDFSLNIVHAFRNPLDVMASLEKRNNIGSIDAAFLWLRYNLDAEFLTRGRPRAFLSYEKLLKKPAKEISNILKVFKISPKFDFKAVKKEIKGTVNSALRHHKSSSEEVILNPLTNSYVSGAYAALKMLEVDPNDSAAMQELDELRAWLDGNTDLLTTLIDLTVKSFEKDKQLLEDKQVSLRQKLKSSEERYTLAEENLDKKETELKDIKSELELTTSNLSSAEQSSAEIILKCRRDSEDLQARLSASLSESRNLSAAIFKLEERLEQRGGELSQLQNTLKQKGNEFVELKEVTSAQNEKFSKQNSILVAEVNGLQQNLYASEQKQAKLTVKVKDLERALIKAGKEYDKAIVQIKERDGSLKNQRRTIRSLQKQNWQLQDRLSIASDQMQGFLLSSSWKLTRPMRVAKRLILGQSLRPIANSSVGATRVPPIAKNHSLEIVDHKEKKVSCNNSALSDLELITKSKGFDANYYLAHYPEVQVSGLSPLEHFLQMGWRKGHQPNAGFNVKAYIASHPELSPGAVNPYIHYLRKIQSKDVAEKYNFSQSDLDKVGKVAIFGAISGGYDALKEPLVRTPNADYFMFSDNEITPGSIWQKLPFEFISSDPTRTARFIKTHPHLYFSDYDWAIWVDANLQINGDLRSLIASQQDSLDVLTWYHPLRDCVYEEAMECSKRSKDNADILTNQLKRYAESGLVKKAGLWETSVFASRMGCGKTIDFMNSWWTEILQGSRRDQIGLPQAIKESDVRIGAIAPRGICMRTDKRFNYFRHTPHS